MNGESLSHEEISGGRDFKVEEGMLQRESRVDHPGNPGGQHGGGAGASMTGRAQQGAGAVFWSLTSEGPDLAQFNFDSFCSSPSPFLLFIPSVLSLLFHRLT